MSAWCFFLIKKFCKLVSQTIFLKWYHSYIKSTQTLPVYWVCFVLNFMLTWLILAITSGMVNMNKQFQKIMKKEESHSVVMLLFGICLKEKNRKVKTETAICNGTLNQLPHICKQSLQKLRYAETCTGHIFLEICTGVYWEKSGKLIYKDNEKLTVVQLVQQFPAFYETWWLIAVLKNDHHQTLTLGDQNWKIKNKQDTSL